MVRAVAGLQVAVGAVRAAGVVKGQRALQAGGLRGSHIFGEGALRRGHGRILPRAGVGVGGGGGRGAAVGHWAAAGTLADDHGTVTVTLLGGSL